MHDDFSMSRPGDLVDKWMEILEPWNTGAMLDEATPRMNRPRTRCCPHSCLLEHPRRTHQHRLPREPLQHFVILPNLLSEPIRSDRHETGAKQSEEKGACSQQCQGKDAAGCQQAASSKDSAESKSEKASGESPWHFSVDMNGCDEVRAMTDKGMLMVEGRGSSDHSQQMVRYITSLPRHVTHDSLTANLNNGRLTVTQKTGPQQLEGQARTLPIDVQQPQQEPKKDQQQAESDAAADKQ